MQNFQNALWIDANLGNPPPIPNNGNYGLSAFLGVTQYTATSAISSVFIANTTWTSNSALSASFFFAASGLIPSLSAGIQSAASVPNTTYIVVISANPVLGQFLIPSNTVYPTISAGFQNGVITTPGIFTWVTNGNPTLAQFFTQAQFNWPFLVISTAGGTVSGVPVMGVLYNNFDLLSAATALILSAASFNPSVAGIVVLSASNGGKSINADVTTTLSFYVSSVAGFTLGYKVGNGTGGAEGGGVAPFTYLSGAQSLLIEVSSFDPNYEDPETLRLLSLFG